MELSELLFAVSPEPSSFLTFPYSHFSCHCPLRKHCSLEHFMNTPLQDLRKQLREQFPEAHQTKPPPDSLQLSSQLPSFPAGALSELSPAGPASGLSLVLATLLQSSDSEYCSPSTPLALIDSHDSFDPASYGESACSRILWIRCHHAEESLRCTDLLLRDGNLPLLVLDLQLSPLDELRKIPTSSWYRLRNLAKQSGSSLLLFTPKPFIPCATLQLTFNSTFTLSDLEHPRETLSLSQQESHLSTASGES